MPKVIMQLTYEIDDINRWEDVFYNVIEQLGIRNGGIELENGFGEKSMLCPKSWEVLVDPNEL